MNTFEELYKLANRGRVSKWKAKDKTGKTDERRWIEAVKRSQSRKENGKKYNFFQIDLDSGAENRLDDDGYDKKIKCVNSLRGKSDKEINKLLCQSWHE